MTASRRCSKCAAFPERARQFLDVGGGPSKEKVTAAFEIISCAATSSPTGSSPRFVRANDLGDAARKIVAAVEEAA
jgi:hypothetical protein